MVANPGIVTLDQLSSTPEAPFGIMTVDCSNPCEIDDGIFVERLDDKEEAYRVGVFVVDTSVLYQERHIVDRAMKVTEAKYWQLDGHEQGYDPMINTNIVKGMDFTAPNERDALVVSFTIGKKAPPSDVDITFGKVEVTENLNYRDFWNRCVADGPDAKYARASAFIIRHLEYTSGGDLDAATSTQNLGAIYDKLIGSRGGRWLKGSRINESFMVAANHLVGRTLAAEGRPAIYRVHDPEDETHLELVPPNVARYSRTPGRHQGLNLDPYCRVTSPLRRLEDFVMSYQLKQRHLGKAATLKDTHDIATAVLQLNRRVIQEAAQDPTRLTKVDTLGKNFRQIMSQDVSESGLVLPMQGRYAIGESA